MRAAQKANKIKDRKGSDLYLKSSECPDVDSDSRMESKSLNSRWKEVWKSKRVKNTWTSISSHPTRFKTATNQTMEQMIVLERIFNQLSQSDRRKKTRSCLRPSVVSLKLRLQLIDNWRKYLRKLTSTMDVSLCRATKHLFCYHLTVSPLKKCKSLPIKIAKMAKLDR